MGRWTLNIFTVATGHEGIFKKVSSQWCNLDFWGTRSVFTLNSLCRKNDLKLPILLSPRLGAGNNGIEGHAWLSVVIRLDQGLCACLGSPAPAELQPQLVQFWNEVSSESHTCHEHQKKPLSSEVYRDAVVAQVFWKSGMSSLMKLHVSTCCLSSLRSWV